MLLAYDLAVAMRHAGIPVISGFHTSVEKDCLDFLLKGTQPVVIVPARGMPKRVPAEWKGPIAEGRLAIVSPFPEQKRRVVQRLAEARNQFVADLAAALFVIHAAPGGKTERFAIKQVSKGKRVLTFDIMENQNLLDAGCERVDPEVVKDIVALRALLRLDM